MLYQKLHGGVPDSARLVTGSELGYGYGAINGMSLGSGMGGLKQDPEAFGHGLGFGGNPTGNGFGMCVGNHYGGGSGTYRWDENE
jgi:hypothetical protein